MELCRIVFTETPRKSLDHVVFLIFRVLILSGLRISEGMLLPSDCLSIEEHRDCVTGKLAGEVGGVSRSVRLRYFVSKRDEGAPDVLVEEAQWVPDIFADALVDAVATALAASADLRVVLERQHECPADYPQSDLRVFRTLDGRTVRTSELLFVAAKFGKETAGKKLPSDLPIGLPSLAKIYSAVGLSGPLERSFFACYGAGETSELKLRPHGLRHLLDGELFRLNVPDTVITRHFGRSSVKQSYQYDHRTLSERLKFVEVPAAAASLVAPGTPQEAVVKLVVSGLAEGSGVVRAFRAIQMKDGDDAAFRYLVANCDGFHVTPYGFCTTSFSVNPCPKHLKCFQDCSQFVPSGLEVHRTSLTQLRERLREAKQKAESRPAKSVGRLNQVRHTSVLIAAVDATLSATPNVPLFPEGQDFSLASRDLLG